MQAQSNKKTMTIQKDTIYALSSTPGRSALSVIRITGETAFLIIEKLTRNRIKNKTPNVYSEFYL